MSRAFFRVTIASVIILVGPVGLSGMVGIGKKTRLPARNFEAAARSKEDAAIVARIRTSRFDAHAAER